MESATSVAEKPVTSEPMAAADSHEDIIPKPSKLFASWPRLQRQLQQPSFWFIVLTLLVVSVVIPIVILLFGLDQRLFPTSLSGVVLDSEAKPLEGATVTIQGQAVSSDAKGAFQIEGLRYGKWQISVEKNGFVSIDEELRLRRGKNEQEYTLLSQEYGVISFSFETAEVFKADEFIISLNDQPLEVNRQNMAISERLLVGTYRLRIGSPYYGDIDQLIQVIPGEQTQMFSLVEAGDVVAEVRDLLTGKIVAKVRGFQLQNGNYIELSATQYDVNQGKLLLKDLLVDEQVGLKFTASGYHDLMVTVKVKQGANSLGNLQLVPSGQIASISESAGQTAIYVSRYDGSVATRVFSTSALCRELVQTRQVAYIDCPGAGMLEVDLATGGSFTHSYRGNYAQMDIWNRRLYVVDNGAQDKLKLATGTEVVLYSSDETVTSVDTTRGGKVLFTTENSIWSVNYDGSDLKQLSAGRFLLADISADGKNALLLNVLADGSKNIWTLDLGTNEKRKLTYLPGDYKDLRFISGDTFVFVEGSKETLNKQTLTSSTATALAFATTRVLTVLDYDLMLIYKADGSYLYNNESATSSQFVLR